jgi:hypothetical protein
MNTVARAQSVTLKNRAVRSQFLLVVTMAVLSACGSRQSEEEQHRQANTTAGKAGQVAHKMAVQAGKASQQIGQELNKAARDAHAGGKEAARKDQAKKK